MLFINNEDFNNIYLIYQLNYQTVIIAYQNSFLVIEVYKK